MTNEELEDISQRCEKATLGQWIPFVEGRDFSSGSTFIMVKDGELRRQDIEIIGATSDDVDFIAHAKQDIPMLIDEVRRLKALINDNWVND